MKYLMSLGGALFLSACTVGPDYVAPERAAPDAFVSQEVLDSLNAGRAAEDIALNWWEGFEDATLNALVMTGLTHNYDIAAAAARLRAARARVRIAGAGDSLTASGRLDGGLEARRDLDGGSQTTTSRDITGGIGLALPLDMFGRVRRQEEAARAAFEGSRAALQGVILDVSTDITGTYLQLYGNRRQLELLRESVALQEKTLAIVRSRYQSGLAPELDLRRAETSVANLRADIPPLEQELLNARHRLATLTGRFAGAYDASLGAESGRLVYARRIPALIPLQMLSLRSSVREAEAALMQAIANIGVAESGFYPDFALGGQVSIGARGESGLPTTTTLIAALSGLIEQVITDGGVRRANLTIAEAEAEEALADYEQALRDATEDVERSLAAIDSSLRRQQFLEKAVSSSQRSFAQAETLYQQGLISFLDVVDAQRVLAQAKQQLARESTNYATQIAELFRALGVNVQR